MNRRSFFKILTGFAAGVYAAFVPGKAKAGIGKTYEHNDYVYECTTAGVGHTAKPTWPPSDWKMTFETRILNDSPVTVISGGDPQEMEKLYAALKEEYPELCD